MVFRIVASLAGLIKVRLSKTQVDNAVFKLHYRWTTAFCFLCCALLAASDFIGPPIQCLYADPAITTFCWVTSTFTINTTSDKVKYYEAYGSEFLGTGTYDEEIHEKTYHAYYQWVPFVLFLQGCLFYLPHQLWKVVEGKHAQNLLQGLNVFGIDEDVLKKERNIIKYLSSSKGLNQKYCFGYVFFEFLNFTNVVTQMMLLNSFFGGMFLEYGSKILSLSLEDDQNRYDPMVQRFPRVTKCHFYKYGPSGTPETLDFLCILPQNLLNEKIFLAMWIWLVFLCCISGMQLVYRAAMIKFPEIRVKLLEQRGKVASTYELGALVRQMHLGDFFLLYTIGKNMNALCFRAILVGLMDNADSEKLPILTPSAPVSTYKKMGYNSMDTMDIKLREKARQDSGI